MKEGHPIAFESRKLNDTERRYTVQEKEMTAVIHYLRTWRQYLLGSKFIIKTDNVTTSYFQTQKKLTPKQARWQDFLAEFDYVMEYKPGRANLVADALSRKGELADISRPQSNLRDRIQWAPTRHTCPNYHPTCQGGQEPSILGRRWLNPHNGKRIYVPSYDNLKREVKKECHDSK